MDRPDPTREADARTRRHPRRPRRLGARSRSARRLAIARSPSIWCSRSRVVTRWRPMPGRSPTRLARLSPVPASRRDRRAVRAVRRRPRAGHGLGGGARPRRDRDLAAAAGGQRRRRRPAPIERLFGVTLRDFSDRAGRTFHAPLGEPRVPRALTGLVAGVDGLDARPSERPAFRGPIAAGPEDGMTPPIIDRVYELEGLRALGLNGEGQTVAIVSLDTFDPVTSRRSIGWPGRPARPSSGSPSTAGSIRPATARTRSRSTSRSSAPSPQRPRSSTTRRPTRAARSRP